MWSVEWCVGDGSGDCDGDGDGGGVAAVPRLRTVPVGFYATK